jgi:hypothetical protein
MSVRRDIRFVEVEMAKHLTPMPGALIEMRPMIDIRKEGPEVRRA